MPEWMDKGRTDEKSDAQTRALMIYREEQAWITAHLAEQIAHQLDAAARLYQMRKSDCAVDLPAETNRFYEERVPGVCVALAERVVGMGTCMQAKPSAGKRHSYSIYIPGERALRRLAQELSERLKKRRISVFFVPAERALYAWADLEQLVPEERL